MIDRWPALGQVAAVLVLTVLAWLLIGAAAWGMTEVVVGL